MYRKENDLKSLESWSWKQWNRRGLNKHEEWTDANKVSVLQMLRNEIMYIMFLYLYLRLIP